MTWGIVEERYERMMTAEAYLIAHHERMMAVELAAFVGVENGRQWPYELTLQRGDGVLHPDLVDNDPVIVHTIRSPRGQD